MGIKLPDQNQIVEFAARMNAKALSILGHGIEKSGLGKGGKLGKIAGGLKKLPQYVEDYPKHFMQGQRARNSYTRGIKSLEAVTASHADEKMAALGRAVEEMLDHPLAERFRRNKIRVFIDNEPVVEPAIKIAAAAQESVQEVAAETGKFAQKIMDAQKAVEAASLPQKRGLKGYIKGYLMKLVEEFHRVQKAGLHQPKIISGKHIIIPREHFDALTAEELKAVVGHEIGHQLRADVHPRRGLEAINRRTQDAERMADEVGVLLSGEPEAQKTGLKKGMTIAQKAMEDVPDGGWLTRWAKRKIAKADQANRLYPSLQERGQLIDELAAKMTTEEGKSHAAEELARRLEAEHRRLFAHQYNRELPHTR